MSQIKYTCPSKAYAMTKSGKEPCEALHEIKVTPIAAESFGVRSMCTLVETPDLTVLLDAGISLCPYRFNLPPHPIEFQTINKLRKRIAEAADKSSVITISHYHFDHHTPSYEDWLVNWTEKTETARQIYQDKHVLLKNPKEKINASQRKRAWLFQKTGGKYAKKLEVADGKTFVYGNTILDFSVPFFHGPDDSMLGWVIMATVKFKDERFLFAPDVQGPMSKIALEEILKVNPSAIMLGGPPLYLKGFKVNDENLDLGLKNLAIIVKEVPLTILEHHALRDEFWQEKVKQVYDVAANFGHRVLTAAEFAGEQNLLLESTRKQLFNETPPSKEYIQWMKNLNAKEIFKPPI